MERPKWMAGMEGRKLGRCVREDGAERRELETHSIF